MDPTPGSGAMMPPTMQGGGPASSPAQRVPDGLPAPTFGGGMGFGGQGGPMGPPSILPPAGQGPLGPPIQAPPQPPAGGGMVDAGYGFGPLNAQGFQQATQPRFSGGPGGVASRVPSAQPGLRQNEGQPAAPPVARPPSIGTQNKLQVHNPTGIGANQASQVAAAKRPNPSVAPKAQGMEPPTPQKAGVGKK